MAFPARYGQPAPTPTALTADEETLFAWLSANVYNKNPSYAKRKLIDRDELLRLISKANLNLASLGKTYSGYGGGKTYYISHGSVYTALENLVKFKKLLSSPFEDMEQGRSYTRNFISCQLPGESVLEHEKRHAEIFKVKAERRSATIKTNSVVLDDTAVKKIENNIAELQSEIASLSWKARGGFRELAYKLESSMMSGEKTLNELWNENQAKIEEFQESIKRAKIIRKEVGAKKEEVKILKKSLKKPVRGLVANPAAMNL